MTMAQAKTRSAKVSDLQPVTDPRRSEGVCEVVSPKIEIAVACDRMNRSSALSSLECITTTTEPRRRHDLTDLRCDHRSSLEHTVYLTSERLNRLNRHPSFALVFDSIRPPVQWSAASRGGLLELKTSSKAKQTSYVYSPPYNKIIIKTMFYHLANFKGGRSYSDRCDVRIDRRRSSCGNFGEPDGAHPGANRVRVCVLNACEEATAIEEDVKHLQHRVFNLALLIIDKVGKNALSELQSRVEDLYIFNSSTIVDLNKLEQQKKLLLIFRDMNKDTVSKCVKVSEGVCEVVSAKIEIAVACYNRNDIMNRKDCPRAFLLPPSSSTMTGRSSWWPETRIKTLKQGKISHPTSMGDVGITPTTSMYALKGGEAFAVTLESLLSLIPVPFVSEFVKVAITVLKACEEATAIEEDVEHLQHRVFNLALLIMGKVGEKPSSELQSRIKDLQFILDSIITDLNKLKQQNKLLLVFFRDMNKDAVSKCVNRLNAALEQFGMSHQLRTEELLGKIRSDHAILMARIEEAVIRTNQPHNAPLIKQDMPPPHRIFYGRQAVVDNIATLLANERTSRVCITGVGGMGKTSVALAVMESPAVNAIFPKKYQFWVPCIEATSPDLFRRILYTQLRITADSYDTLDSLINELDVSKIDDFYFSITLRPHAKLPHVALMVTMTSAFPPSDEVDWRNIPLPSLDRLAAAKPSRAVGCIPIAITLMAANGKHSQASPDELLQEWRTAGTNMVSRVDHTISLSVNREIIKSNPEAFTLLAVLSMLPAGTTGNNLRWWAPTLTSHSATVGVLRVAALLEQGDGDFGTSRIFVRPTIKAYMSQHNRISTEVYEQVHNSCYKFVLDHKSIPDDAKFKDDLAALAAEETNIQNILMQVDVQGLRPDALNALIAFSFYQLCTKTSTVIALHALDIAQATDNTDAPLKLA
ncbi:hypothetical protein BDP27DRAFT_1452565 [Rhodocollybia butyracea]|uniref:NB-ARC domain-containing protein n=1 Tax=Rhodocollybia butyracea TaxID=206335 RepID=A0A9P5TZU9_9AGAR|nr:hypothetical protein BDP27DRAFT_1452565 [Rhodocollybia butyracea]